MSNTLVNVVDHQSNGVGKNGSTSVSPGNAPSYVTRHTGIRYLSWGGILVPASWTEHAAEPISDPTNASDGVMHSRRAAADALSTLGNSPGLMVADALKDGGMTQNMIVVPTGLASTFVDQDWVDTGGFDTQECRATLLGGAKCRVNYVMRHAPNALLGLWLGCLGESEAFNLDGAIPSDPATHLATAIAAKCDSINSWASRNGWSWHKNHHFAMPLLSAGYGNPPLSAPYITLVRNAQIAVAAARSDILLVVDAFAGAHLHLDEPEQQDRATAIATAYLAAT